MDDATQDGPLGGSPEATTETDSGPSGGVRSVQAPYSPSIFDRLRAAIEPIPTEPRRPETLGSVVPALVLPVVIWLFQHSLQRWLP